MPTPEELAAHLRKGGFNGDRDTIAYLGTFRMYDIFGTVEDLAAFHHGTAVKRAISCRSHRRRSVKAACKERRLQHCPLPAVGSAAVSSDTVVNNLPVVRLPARVACDEGDGARDGDGSDTSRHRRPAPADFVDENGDVRGRYSGTKDSYGSGTNDNNGDWDRVVIGDNHECSDVDDVEGDATVREGDGDHDGDGWDGVASDGNSLPGGASPGTVVDVSAECEDGTRQATTTGGDLPRQGHSRSRGVSGGDCGPLVRRDTNQVLEFGRAVLTRRSAIVQKPILEPRTQQLVSR